jgi:hypothetical protein
VVKRGERCRDCKHWGDYGIDPLAVGPYDGMRVCGLTMVAPTGQPVFKESGALALVTTRQRAALMTDPSFGCVQWEKRDA